MKKEKNNKNKWLRLLKEFIFLIIAVILVGVFRNDFVISASILVLLAICFLIEYYKREWMVFVLGVLIGFIMEAGGDMIYKLQYWNQTTLFGMMPLWLPLIWGIGFILIRRIGTIIVEWEK